MIEFIKTNFEVIVLVWASSGATIFLICFPMILAFGRQQIPNPFFRFFASMMISMGASIVPPFTLFVIFILLMAAGRSRTTTVEVNENA